MFYVDKKASGEHLAHCSQIMDRIVSENPSYWPHGCNPDMFNGGVYLIRKSASHEPVGFTGWQEFNEDGKKVGYYSIGILPEYRQQGFAKEAVAKLINEKSATVDEVRALVMEHNKPSLELAKALNVNTLVKNAMTAPQMLGRLAGGLAASGGMDYLMHDGDYSHVSKGRVANVLFNTLLGTAGSHFLASADPSGFNKGLAAIISIPGKDLTLSAASMMPKLEGLLDKNLRDQPLVQPFLSGKEKLILGGLLGAGALGVTGAGLNLARVLNKAQEKRDAGRIQLRLPTRDKNDQETVVDVPLDQANLPPALVSKVMRDTRRKLREETKARTWRRGDKNRLLTNAEPGYDDYDMDPEEEFEKAAFAYYKAKLNVKNANTLKPFSIVNTMAESPDKAKLRLEEKRLQLDEDVAKKNVDGGNEISNDGNSEELKKLKEANDNLQRQMASMQHTNDLNKETLKNISARTSAIANNLKIAGLVKLAAPQEDDEQPAVPTPPRTATPNKFRTYEQFVTKDMPAAWREKEQLLQSTKNLPPEYQEPPRGFFENTFLKPDDVKQRELDQAYNQAKLTPMQNPRLVGDYVTNAGKSVYNAIVPNLGYAAGKSLDFVSSPFKNLFRRAAFGEKQLVDAFNPNEYAYEEGESRFNPTTTRLNSALSGVGNFLGGSAGLYALGRGAFPLRAGTSGFGKFMTRIFNPTAAGITASRIEPKQTKSTFNKSSTDTVAGTRAAQPYYTPAEMQELNKRLADSYRSGNLVSELEALGPNAYGSNPFYEKLGIEKKPLSTTDQMALEMATGGMGAKARQYLSGLTGDLAFKDESPTDNPKINLADLRNMRTPLH